MNFLKYKLIYFLLSATVISAGLFSIVKWGFKYSIDFVGGTNMVYQTERKVNLNDLRKVFIEKKIEVSEVVQKDTVITIRAKAIDETKEKTVKGDLEKKLKTNITILRSETVGPVLGKETMMKTLIAAVIATIGILIYMSFSFKGFNFALSAVLAMFHDLLVVVGSYSLLSRFFGAEVDTMFVTAVLTTMSFSVHDTIVIFDKIREYRSEERVEMEQGVNKALTETMVRSLNNSMTIIFMLLALTLLGGSTIRFFVATLLIGTITGTYSSPFIATPILVWLERKKR